MSQESTSSPEENGGGHEPVDPYIELSDPLAEATFADIAEALNEKPESIRVKSRGLMNAVYELFLNAQQRGVVTVTDDLMIYGQVQHEGFYRLLLTADGLTPPRGKTGQMEAIELFFRDQDIVLDPSFEQKEYLRHVRHTFIRHTHQDADGTPVIERYTLTESGLLHWSEQADEVEPEIDQVQKLKDLSITVGSDFVLAVPRRPGRLFPEETRVDNDNTSEDITPETPEIVDEDPTQEVLMGDFELLYQVVAGKLHDAIELSLEDIDRTEGGGYLRESPEDQTLRIYLTEEKYVQSNRPKRGALIIIENVYRGFIDELAEQSDPFDRRVIIDETSIMRVLKNFTVELRSNRGKAKKVWSISPGSIANGGEVVYDDPDEIASASRTIIEEIAELVPRRRVIK